MGNSALILVTNDDGIFAGGIRALAEGLAALGEVRVVAPMGECSGSGCRITLKDPLRAFPVKRGGAQFGVGVEGSPVDCVKMAVKVFLPRRPDLLVSGINHGANLGVNAFYSGTVGAALEGALLGIPSLALSVTRFQEPQYELAVEVGVSLAMGILEGGFPEGAFLNVNVPHLPREQVRGARLTRQSSGGYKERYEQRTDPLGQQYWWITGRPEVRGADDSYDDAAVCEGYVSITPMAADLTMAPGKAGLERFAEGLDLILARGPGEAGRGRETSCSS